MLSVVWSEMQRTYKDFLDNWSREPLFPLRILEKQSPAWSASSHVLAELCWRGLGWWRLMLESIAIGVLTCKLWNLWLSGSQSSLSGEARLCDPTVLCWPSHQGRSALKTHVYLSAGLISLPFFFCFISVVTWACWCNSRTAHCVLPPNSIFVQILSLTSWQPGGLWDWLPQWSVHFVSLGKVSRALFDLFWISSNLVSVLM